MLQWLLNLTVISPVLKPAVRILVGVVAIPLFRLLMRKTASDKRLSEELVKDLEQWFRGCLLLMLATQNVENYIFHDLLQIGAKQSHSTLFEDDSPGISPPVLADGNPAETARTPAAGTSQTSSDPAADDETAAARHKRSKREWLFLAMRLLLAFSVIEQMPDQALFSIIHAGPVHLLFPRGQVFLAIRNQMWPYLRGQLSRYLDRTSSVFAVLTVIVDGPLGWLFYSLAIAQFLIIGLVSSRDKAIDALSRFDRQIRSRREELVQELNATTGAGA